MSIAGSYSHSVCRPVRNRNEDQAQGGGGKARRIAAGAFAFLDGAFEQGLNQVDQLLDLANAPD